MLEILIGSLLLAGLSSQYEYERERNRKEALLRLFPPPEPSIEPGSQFDPEQPFSIQGIVFDAKNGLGNTPINANVNYMGFVVWMTPNKFLALNPMRDLGKGDWVRDRVKEGSPISAPFLIAKITSGEVLDDYDLWEHERNGAPLPSPERLGLRVYQHEGRTRSAALAALGLGDVPIPVSVYLRPEVRARMLLPGHILGATLEYDNRCKSSATHMCRSLQIRRITLNKVNYGI